MRLRLYGTISTEVDPETLNNIAELPSLESTQGFRWQPETAQTIQRTTLAVGGVVALGGGIAALRADYFADLANAESGSQSQFDEYSLKSEQWRSIFVMSSVALGNVASFYLGTKWLEWWAVDTATEAGQGRTTDVNHTEGEEQ